jgi:hypothetical protein
MIGKIFYLMFVFWPCTITGLQTVPDQLWGPPSLLFSGNSGSKAVGM